MKKLLSIVFTSLFVLCGCTRKTDSSISESLSESASSNSKVENKYISSTPKFSQTLQDKETVNKNNSFDLDLPSLEDNKFSTEKKDRPIFIDKE